MPTAAATKALTQVLDDQEWRSELSTQGLKRASEFSWQATAAQTLAIYEQQIH